MAFFGVTSPNTFAGGIRNSSPPDGLCSFAFLREDAHTLGSKSIRFSNPIDRMDCLRRYLTP